MAKDRMIPRGLLDRVVAKQQHLCFYCLLPFGTVTNKGTQNLVGDHWIPYVVGGNDQEDNVVAACHICNAYKYDHIFDNIEDARRYILKRRNDKRISVWWVPDVAVTEDPMRWARGYAAFLTT